MFIIIYWIFLQWLPKRVFCVSALRELSFFVHKPIVEHKWVKKQECHTKLCCMTGASMSTKWLPSAAILEQHAQYRYNRTRKMTPHNHGWYALWWAHRPITPRQLCELLKLEDKEGWMLPRWKGKVFFPSTIWVMIIPLQNHRIQWPTLRGHLLPEWKCSTNGLYIVCGTE